MQWWLRTVTLRVGRRGAFLLFLALLDFVYAYGLAFPGAAANTSATYRFLAAVAPLDAWALLWATVGLTYLAFAFRKKDAPGYAAAMFVKVLWAVTFPLGWLFADVERGYLSTAIWGAFAAVLGLIATWGDDARDGRE
jgi:hypothetical protein